MATQTVEFRAATGLTLTAKLFAAGNDTEVASVSATEATNRKGTYSAAYTDVAAGEYQLIALDGTTPVASWWVTLTLTTATFGVYDKADTRDIVADTQDIQSRLPAALVSGRMDSSVGNMESNVITASVLATGAITASAIQTNAITDDKLAASAITEIQAGLATTTQLTTVESKVDAIDDFVDTEVAAIKGVTDKLDTTVELDGAVYRFTTNALEQAPSGGSGSTVIVSPLSALAPERVNGTTISVAVGDLTPVTIDVYDANDAAVNLSTQGNLEVCIESRDNVDLQVVAHASITISGASSNKATWTPNAAAVGTVDKHRWSLRTASAKKVLAYGPWVVERVALSDV